MTTTTQDVVPVLYTNWGKDTSSWGPTRCPTGEYLASLEWWENNWMQQLKGVCSGGGALAPFRDGGGWQLNSLAPAGGWDGLGVQANHAILGINGVRHTKDIPAIIDAKLNCSNGQKVVGYHGKHSGQIDSLGIVCDYTKEYCSENLESDFCKEHPEFVTKAALNKACATKMTDTCRNRKEELFSSVVQAYCKNHLDDDLCSCDVRNTVPSYIAPEIAALRQCWNDKCASVGYRFNEDKCPPITVCRQDLKGQDNNNMVSGNVQVLDCGGSGGKTGAPAPSTGGGISSTLLIIIGVLLLAGGFYYVKSKPTDPGVYVQGSDGQVYAKAIFEPKGQGERFGQR